MKRTGSGFTIVELLIVIVVIAILAAITIVAYNGITERARNSEMVARIDAYTKILQLYKAKEGAFPSVPASESGVADLACLGTPSEYPDASPALTAGQCYKPSSGAPSTTSATLNSNLQSVASTLPKGSTPMAISNDSSMAIRGILYLKYGAGAMIQYVVKGDQDCARGVKNYNLPAWPGMTVCIIGLS